MAIAKAVSAAANAIMNMVKMAPCNKFGYKYVFISTKFIAAAFKINSIDSNTVIKFSLVKNPYTPIKNKTLVRVKIS